MSKTFNIAVLPGDGIGPEIVAEASRILELVASKSSDFALKLTQYDFGGAAIDSSGDPYPASTRQACKAADAILLGASLSPHLRFASRPPPKLICFAFSLALEGTTG